MTGKILTDCSGVKHDMGACSAFVGSGKHVAIQRHYYSAYNTLALTLEVSNRHFLKTLLYGNNWKYSNIAISCRKKIMGKY